MGSLKSALVLGALALGACSSIDIHPYETPNASISAFDRAYQDGKAYFNSDHLGLAIVNFERALRFDPRSVNALNAIGACYDDLHRPDVAMSFYQEAMTIAPQDADTYNNIGVSLLMAGKKVEALAYLEKAAALNAKEHTIQLNVEIARAKPEARVTARAPTEDDPDRPRIVRTDLNAFALYIPVTAHSERGDSRTVDFRIDPAESLPATPRVPVEVEPLGVLRRADVAPNVSDRLDVG